MLDVEDGLVVLFHLPCQPREPVHGLLRRVARLCAPVPEHALDVALEDLSLPLCKGSPFQELLQGQALIGQGQDTEHQRRARELAQHGIPVQGCTKCIERFPCLFHIRFNLYWGKGLHRHGTVQDDPLGLHEIVVAATTHDHWQQAVLPAKGVDRLDTSFSVLCCHFVHSVKQG